LGGNVLGSATGLATINTIINENLVDKVSKDELKVRAFFNELKEEFEFLGDYRGKGLLFGLEIVEKDNTPSQKLAHKICYAAWKNGLVIYYLWVYSNSIIISPPLIIQDRDLEEGLGRLRIAFKDVREGKILDEDIAPFAGW
jgi:4-aminobutyrate aminotransferase